MNCDTCIYRVACPGSPIGWAPRSAPTTTRTTRAHAHSHCHEPHGRTAPTSATTATPSAGPGWSTSRSTSGRRAAAWLTDGSPPLRPRRATRTRPRRAQRRRRAARPAPGRGAAHRRSRRGVRADRPRARPRHAVVVHPQFTEPEVALRAAGHAVERVVLAPSRFAPRPGRSRPTPTWSSSATPRTRRRCCTRRRRSPRSPGPGRSLVVDEAFADAVPGEPESLAARRPARPAGRPQPDQDLGAGRAADRLRARRRRRWSRGCAAAQPLWPVSRRRSAAAVACCAAAGGGRGRDGAGASTAERDDLIARLRRLPASTWRATAQRSFVLVRTRRRRGCAEPLRDSGFAVRRGDTFPGLGPDWFRVAVRDDRTSPTAFVHALRRLRPY